MPKILQSKLFFQLALSLLLALSIVFSVNLVARYLWEIPTYLKLEQQADLREQSRISNTLRYLEYALMETYASLTYWDELYHFLRKPQGDFLEKNFGRGDWDESYSSALFLIDLNMNVIWSYQSKVFTESIVKTGLKVSDLERVAKEHAAISPHQSIRGMTAAGGISAEFPSPLVFYAQPIFSRDITRGYSGFLVAWDSLQGERLEGLQHSLQSDFAFSKLSEADVSALAVSGFDAERKPISRDHNNMIEWVLKDYLGRPAYRVYQFLDQRHFNDRVIDRNTVIEMSAALIVFLTLALSITRRLITPIRALQKSMQHIQDHQQYNTRVNADSGNELGDLSRSYNTLLDHIQYQESALLDANNELLKQSNMDALTGIANRRAFDTFLADSHKQVPLSLMMIDIDYFKQYNDRYGHPQGDKALQSVAKCLHSNSHSSTDLVARYGGEEFTVVLTLTTLPQAKSVAERIRRAIENLHIVHEGSDCGYLTVSIGIACREVTQPDVDLVKQSDQALYQAKAQGRNQVVTFV